MSVAGRRRVVPPCTPPSMPTALTCPPGHSASPTLLSGTTPRARWLSLGTGGPRAGPHRDGLHSLSVCRPARTRCALGPGPRPRRNSHPPLSPASGSCLESGRRGEAAASSTRCGCCGAGGPGAAGWGAGPQPRAPEAPRDLGGHDGPRGLGSDSPCPLPVPAGETQGPGTSLALHFPAGTSPLPAGRPLPRGALPPASLSSQASLGACWAC